jgi:hypothetical protein
VGRLIRSTHDAEKVAGISDKIMRKIRMFGALFTVEIALNLSRDMP